ncbi:MAG: hypothetical protein K8953_12165, partial [Proteobacteria bacterium]|nr:hypothetical protein [Pseudomonadota bacterium]
YKQLRINECIAVAFGMTADPVNAFGSDDDRCPALVTEHCTANPFANNVHCMPGTYDGDRLKFANDCYGSDKSKCNNIKGCLNPANLFSDSAQFGGIACNNTALNGVRARYCSEGDNIVTSEECAAASLMDSRNSDVNSCIYNPFDAHDSETCKDLLGVGFDEAKENRINHCFKDGNGGNLTCVGARGAESCIINLFDAACDKYDCTIVPDGESPCPQHESIRQQRVDYCLDITVFRTTVCTPARAVVCVVDADNMSDFDDVFAPLCRAFAYLDERAEVAELCVGDTMPKPKTCDRIATCIADPYTDSTLCNDEALTLAELKPKRIEACKSVTDPGVICAEQALVEVCNTTPFAWHCHP